MTLSEKPSREELNQWHSDPENWKKGIFYYNKKDPRVWLPKKNPIMGWTLNFAHFSAYVWLVVLLLISIISSILIGIFGNN